MQRIVDEMMAETRTLVKGLVDAANRVQDQQDAEALERSVRENGQQFLQGLLERLLQSVLDRRAEARVCPKCQARRRHKGVRERGVVSSVGAIRLKGPYWYCRGCREGQHALDVLVPESVSGVLRELLCLLGTSLASFAKASAASEKLLGVGLSTDMIWQLCRREGHKVLADPPKPSEVPKNTDLVGSCDGTSVIGTVKNSTRTAAGRSGTVCGGFGTRIPRGKRVWRPCWGTYSATRIGWTTRRTSGPAGRSAAGGWRATASNWAGV